MVRFKGNPKYVKRKGRRGIRYHLRTKKNKQSRAIQRVQRLKAIPKNRLPKGWTEGKGSDKDFRIWQSNRYLVRIWKTAETKGKPPRRTGKYFYETVLTKKGGRHVDEYKTYSPNIAVEKALKFMRDVNRGKYN